MDAFYEKVSGAVAAAVTVAFTPYLWRKFMAWWRRPSERKELSTAIGRLTGEVSQIRAEFQLIGKGFATLSEQSIIATSISRIALNDSSTPRWETDENGQCVWVSTSLAKMFGMSPGEMLGTGWTKAIAPGHQAEVSKAFREAYKAPDDYSYVHPYAISVHGKLINVVARSVEVIRKPDGSILRMFGTVRPIDSHFPEQTAA